MPHTYVTFWEKLCLDGSTVTHACNIMKTIAKNKIPKKYKSFGFGLVPNL